VAAMLAAAALAFVLVFPWRLRAKADVTLHL
jgi:hypothetical protein